MVDLTPELRIAINVALENAQHRRHEFAGTEHLFLGLLHDKVTAKAVKACGGNVNKLLALTEAFLDEYVPAVPEGRRVSTAPSLGFQEAIQYAALNAESSEREVVAGPHVLIAMYNLQDCHAVYLLKQQGIEKLDLQQYVSHGGGTDDDDDEGISFSVGGDD
ncbi:MAG: ATP-dependent Clp protease ATP-binding subunit ClpA, partial [Myxococcales bacterium]|nr:ATP-dependent Clp protease ATP-binding subunit ClpA [Myxococcales bacterium]